MVIWSLFDGSGIMGLPWAEAGHEVCCFNADDADHGAYESAKVIHGNIRYINVWIDGAFMLDAMAGDYGKPDIIFAFPPCTDTAVSGAAHFAKKYEIDPLFQEKAVKTARIAEFIAGYFNVPYMIENPVSVLSTKWRSANFSFHPYEFGAYLPNDDKHPTYPDYIKPRDAYPKKTCIWTSGNFRIPPRKPVAVNDGYSDQHKKLGGKSQKTKVIRSLTPRGFSIAVYMENYNLLEKSNVPANPAGPDLR